MLKIAFHIPKGGVGKTSLAGNVAFYASRSMKTILLDGDPQGNTTSWFVTGSIDQELSDVLQGKAEAKEVVLPIKDSLDLLPTAGIGGDLKNYAEGLLMQEPFVFDDLNDELVKLGYKLAIYDLSPGMSMLEKCVIHSCDEVISPMSPEYFSIDGLEAFGTAIKEINRRFRKNVRYSKLVINCMNRSFRQHRKNYDRLQELDLNIFLVPQDRAIADSQAAHKTIFEYKPTSKSVESLKSLSEAIMGA